MTTSELQEYGKPAPAMTPVVAPKTKATTANDESDVEEIPTLAPKPLDNKDLPCAFWDSMLEPGADHPDLAAIEALKAESSPMERAETLKVQANDALKRGMQLKKSFYVLEGVSLYNQALALLAPSVERTSAGEFVGAEGEGGEGATSPSPSAADDDATKEALSKNGKGNEEDDGGDEGTDAAPFPPPRPEELASIRATLHSNRAQAHLALGNDRRALSDALAASKLFAEASGEPGADSGLTKAHFRAARAALRLREWSAARDAIERGKENAAKGSESSLVADFEALALSLSRSEAATRKADEERRAADAAARAPSLELAKEIYCSRKWRVGCPQLSVGADRNKPWAVSEGREGVGEGRKKIIHWPMVFIYPESGATDAVEAASELDSISSHLDAMFGSSEDLSVPAPPPPPLPWDEHGAYSNRKDVELYYLSHATEPLPSVDALAEVLYKGWPEGIKPVPPQRHGPKAARAIKVDERLTLGEILSKENYVVPGIPAFFVLSKSAKGRASEVRRRFLEEHG